MRRREWRVLDNRKVLPPELLLDGRNISKNNLKFNLIKICGIAVFRDFILDKIEMNLIYRQQ